MANLALFDLDNTLLDRQAAFSTWATSFIAAHGLPSHAWSIIESVDEEGLTPRDEFFSQIRGEFGLTTSAQKLLDLYHLDYPACFAVDDETVRAVRSLRQNGWKVGVVTNGPPTQLAKLEATNLVKEFDAI
ncbi:MAG: HAD family hydrolase [Acidimicrobiales bacterium]